MTAGGRFECPTAGLRLLERQAVRDGGGHNHRMSLSDAVMIKDNHWAAMGIADGAAEGFDLALAFHNQPDMQVGSFGWVRGANLAAADRFDLVVRGRSGHAAHPDDAIDPIVAGAAFVSQAQTVVSREIDPLHPAVVTVGVFHGGTAPNIIPESVELRGTVRTLHADARNTAEASLRRLAAGLEAMHRVRCELSYRRGVPPLVNSDRVLDPAVAAVVAGYAAPLEAMRRRAASTRATTWASQSRSCNAASAPACPMRLTPKWLRTRSKAAPVPSRSVNGMLNSSA